VKAVTLAIFLLFADSLWAQDSYDQILDIAERFQKEKKVMESLEDKKRGLMGTVYTLERETRKIAKVKSRLKNEEIGLNRDLKQSTGKIVKLEDRIISITKNLQRRLDTARTMGSMPWMYILLTAYNPIELQRTEKIMKSLNAAEAKVVGEYLSSLAELRLEKEHLYELAKKLISVGKEIKTQEEELKNQHAFKKKILVRLEGQIASQKESLTRNRHLGIKMTSQNELQNLRLLFATSFFDKKGGLPHPANGPILHGFGLNDRLLRKNVRVMNKGNFYRLPAGGKASAVAEGQVEYVGRLDGIGRVVIIDHGANYYAVYSNLKSTAVKQNAMVKGGDLIGNVGYNSRDFGTGLYFEIRHYSEAENPKDWLKPVLPKEQLAHKTLYKEGGS